MKKTSVYLTDDEVEILRRLAEREGKSQAMVLREAIVAYDAEREAIPDRHFAIFAVEGSGASTDGRSVADMTDEELLAGFGEDSDPDWELRHPGQRRSLPSGAWKWPDEATAEKGQ